MNNIDVLKSSFRIWNDLSDKDKEELINNGKDLSYKKGDVIHKGSITCLGLIIIKSGALRAYITSPNGKQITIYKLFNNDICLLSASCIMKDINFDIYLECEEDTEILLIPTDKYKLMLEKSPIISNYINSILTSRFSDAMWVLEQVTFHSLDKRLATYLLEQDNNDDVINTTHEKIANDLGSAREVISRMLKYFENENIICLSRNKIKILDYDKLYEISEK